VRPQLADRAERLVAARFADAEQIAVCGLAVQCSRCRWRLSRRGIVAHDVAPRTTWRGCG
jgi:hypothetical protein